MIRSKTRKACKGTRKARKSCKIQLGMGMGTSPYSKEMAATMRRMQARKRAARGGLSFFGKLFSKRRAPPPPQPPQPPKKI